MYFGPISSEAEPIRTIHRALELIAVAFCQAALAADLMGIPCS
jgi:hypothetical protein